MAGVPQQQSADWTRLAVWFHSRLTQTPEALGVLGRRLPNPEALVDLLLIGLTPPNFSAAWMLSDRIVIPLWRDNTVVGFRALRWRAWDKRPKSVGYFVDADTRHDAFGVCPHTASRFGASPFCVMVEGEMDCLTLWGLGIPGIASCGAVLDHETVVRLRAVVDCALVWPDADAAGRNGSAVSVERLRSLGVDACYVSAVPGCKDANQVFTERGHEVLRRHLSLALYHAAAGLSRWME